MRNGPRGGARNYVPKNYRERARKKCGPADVQDVSISRRNAQVHIDPHKKETTPLKHIDWRKKKGIGERMCMGTCADRDEHTTKAKQRIGA